MKQFIILISLITIFYSCNTTTNNKPIQTDTTVTDSIVIPLNDEIDTIAAPSRFKSARVAAEPDFWNPAYRSNKVVNLYVEVGNDLFLKYGVNTETEVKRVFQMASDISESLTGVRFQINKIRIWTTPDPYSSLTSISSTLYAFSTNNQTETTPFKIFVNNKNLGGQAFISRGSVTSAKFAVATFANRRALNTTVFSFDLYCIIHEIYHNLGLSHSQNDCAWLSKTGARLGRLDSCVACEASTACTRSVNCNGSTKRMAGDIMSYCHIWNTTTYKLHPAELAVLHKSLWYSTLPDYTPTVTPVVSTIDTTGIVYQGNSFRFSRDGNTSTRWVTQGPSSVTFNNINKNITNITIHTGFLSGTNWVSPVKSIQILVNGVIFYTITNNTNTTLTIPINVNASTLRILFRDTDFNRVREIVF